MSLVEPKKRPEKPLKGVEGGLLRGIIGNWIAMR